MKIKVGEEPVRAHIILHAAHVLDCTATRTVFDLHLNMHYTQQSKHGCHIRFSTSLRSVKDVCLQSSSKVKALGVSGS